MFKAILVLALGAVSLLSLAPPPTDPVLCLELAGSLADTGANAARSDGIAGGGVGTYVEGGVPKDAVGSDGKALVFDGKDDSVSFPGKVGAEKELLFAGAEPFSVCVRLRFDHLNGIQHVFSRWPNGHSLFHQNSLCFAVRPMGPTVFIGTGHSIEAKRWYDVACVYTGPGKDNVNIYLHDTASGDFLGHSQTVIDRPLKADTPAITMGSRGGDNHFAGQIERVLAFRRALTPNEIHALTTTKEWSFVNGKRDRFPKVRTLRYAPDALVPFAGPAFAADWDGDGLVDLLGRNSLYRNSGKKDANGLPIHESPVRINLPTTVRGDLNGDGIADCVASHRNGFSWYAGEQGDKGLRFVKQGDLQHPLGRAVPIPETGEATPKPALVDWDGDGRVDLLSGTRSVGLGKYLPSNGPGFQRGWADGTWYFRDMTATIYLHRNVGTPQKPLFTDGLLLTTGKLARAITFFDTVWPLPVDWNGDGRTDLMVATFDRVVVFLDTNTKGEPALDDGHVVTFGGRNTTTFERRPTHAYRGKDGLWRINVGGSMVRQARQLAKNDPFRFGPLQLLHMRGGSLRLANFSVPAAVDWDHDGRQDMLVGTEDGFVWFVRNLDPKGGAESWAAPVALQADGKDIRPVNYKHLQGPCEWWWGYTNPCVTDWDMDGDLDLILGFVGETFLYYENTGTRDQPVLAARGNLQCATGDVVTAWRTRPGVGDLDGDGLADLIGIDGERHLTWWRRTRSAAGELGLAAPAKLSGMSGVPFLACGSVRGTGRTKLAVCDWDGDGVQDILGSPRVHKRDAAQLFFRGLGVRDGVPRFHLDTNRVFTGYNGHYSMAEPVDLDGDGTWEILSGRDAGYLQYWTK